MNRFISLKSAPFPLGAILLAVLAIFSPNAARADSEPVYGRSGMVVTPDAYATDAGLEILRQGGNAFDAAAAVGFALAVSYPQAGNLGGGGFCVALKADGTPLALDMRETAPLGASRDMYLDMDGNVVDGLSLHSHLAVGVPGTVDGLLKLQADHGALKREQVLAPAIRLAEDGIDVSHFLNKSFEEQKGELPKYEATRKIFFPEGKAIGFGERLKQPDLAKTLRRIASDGRAGFYEGETADLIVAEMKRHGGLITRDDLRKYHAWYREPLRFERGGYEFITHPLPSSGGIALAQILGLIDMEQLRGSAFNSADYVSRLAEAERLAYADRNYFLGDGDFVDVPVQALISSDYLEKRKRLLPPEGQAGKSSGVDHGEIESEETTHFCVADSEGNVVAITTTLNALFGMGAVVEGAGFLLNNEMDDFSAKPGVPNLYGLVGAEANSIASGKRMLSSMTPTIVKRNGRFWLTVGTPGGSTIITSVLQLFLNEAIGGMNIREAIDAGRFHHQWLPDIVFYEPRALAKETVEELKSRGYQLSERPSIGMAAGIEKTSEGIYAGYADRRGPGVAAGY